LGPITPTPEFRENSRERGARSPADRSQRFDPPLGAQTFAEQSAAVCLRGAARAGLARGAADGKAVPGRGLPGTADGAGAAGVRGSWAGGAAGRETRRAGRQRPPWRARGGFPGRCRGQPGPGRAGCWGQTWPNRAAAAACRKVPNFPGPVSGRKPWKNGGRGRKSRLSGPFGGPVRSGAGRGGRSFRKNTGIRRRKKLHKPCSLIQVWGRGGRFAPAYALYRKPFFGPFFFVG